MNGSATKSPASLEGLRVLVVDDEPDSRDILSYVLSRFGAEVVTAGSVREAWSLIHAFAPNVLISDIAMPGENGYALIRAVRAAEGEIANIPSLALTAFASAHDRESARAAGFDMHISKPADMELLAEAVARLAERHLA